MKLAFMSFLVASTSALVHAEALRSNVIVLSVLTASARSVEGHLRQDTSPTLDEQPLIDGEDTVLQVDRFPWLSNAMKINNNAVILEEPDIIEDEDDPRYHRLPSFTSISAFVDQQGPSESSSISSHPAFADQEHGASASYTLAHGRLRKDTSPTLDEQPLIDGDNTVLQDDNGSRFLNAINWNWNHFPWLSNAMKINNNAVILEEPDIIEDEDDPRYHRFPSFTSISAFVDQQGPSESSSISSHPVFADQEHGASATYTLAHGHRQQDTSPTLDRIIKNIIKDEDVKINNYSRDQKRYLLSPWCDSTTPEMWHPNFSVAWSGRGCTLKADCDSRGYSTQVECCKGAFGGQMSGACIKGLPNPPTFSPTTAAGASGKWYVDQGGAWSTGGCKNTIPYPTYATVFFDTQLLCCKGAFGGQTSGACINGLPNPPTFSPTTAAGASGKWYVDQGGSWSTGGCKNTIPYPIYATVFLYEDYQDCRLLLGR